KDIAMVAAIANSEEISILATENEFRFAVTVHVTADDSAGSGRELHLPKAFAGDRVKTYQGAVGLHLSAAPAACIGRGQEALIEAGIPVAHRPAFGRQILVPQTPFAIE